VACTGSPVKVSGTGRESRLSDSLPISFPAVYTLRSDPCNMFIICTLPWDGFILSASNCNVSF